MEDFKKLEIIAFLQEQGYQITGENENEVATRFNNRRQDMGLGHSEEDYEILMDEVGDEIMDPFKFIEEFRDFS